MQSMAHASMEINDEDQCDDRRCFFAFGDEEFNLRSPN
jgi:hypothetical protein